MPAFVFLDLLKGETEVLRQELLTQAEKLASQPDARSDVQVDEFIAGEMKAVAGRTPVIGIVTKTDRAQPEQIAARLTELTALEIGFAELVPVSATRGFQVDLLSDLLVARLPEGPPLYPDGELTDEPEEILVAELVREAALEGVRDELPHSIAVTIDEMPRRESGLQEIFATLHVERDSQKGIVIGPKGARLKRIGTTARAGIEALLGERVHLALHVAVERDWQRDPKKLDRLGF